MINFRERDSSCMSMLNSKGSWILITLESTIFEGDNPSLHRIDESIIVGRYDNSLSFLIEFFEEEDDFFCIFRVEISCRFIPDDDARMMDQCPCYRCSLEFSTRESLDEFIFFLKESDLRENFGYSFFDNRITVATYFHGKGDIFFYGFFSEEFEILKNHSDTPSIGEEFI